MSNATLEMMQEIEQAAQGVIATYEEQVEQVRTDSRDRLATVAQHYDEEPSNWSQRLKPVPKKNLSL